LANPAINPVDWKKIISHKRLKQEGEKIISSTSIGINSYARRYVQLHI
jgi:hypothetical protein